MLCALFCNFLHFFALLPPPRPFVFNHLRTLLLSWRGREGPPTEARDYCTCRVTIVVRTVVPDVAVTRTWKVPAGVKVDALLLDPPPPHPATVNTPSKSARAGTSTAKRRTPRLYFCCVSSTRNKTAARKLAKAYSQSMGGEGWWKPMGGAAPAVPPPGPVVNTHSVTVTELPLGVCVGCGNSAATPCGKHVAGATAVAQNVTGPGNPFGPGVSVIGKVAS